MPDSEVDESVFFVAGCIVDPNPLKFICQGCDHQFGARLKLGYG
jgi:hypothetical protein